MYIVPADFDDLLEKGVAASILDRDEGEYFSTVTTLHPLARTNQTIQLSFNNEIIQYGWKTSIAQLNRFSLVKIFGTLKILFKILFIFPFEIKRKSIDIIRATDPYYMGLIAVYYSFLFNIPFVVSIHADYDKNYEIDNEKGSFTILGSRRQAIKVEKYILKKCKRILPISKFLRDKYIKKHNLPKEKFYIFHHGIDLEKFDKSKYINIYNQFDIPQNKKIISFIGRLSKENYIYDVLQIGIKLSKLNKDFFLLIVGGGNEFQSINDKIKTYPFIKAVGFQNRKIVVNVNKQSFTSLCLLSGFSLLEACAGNNSIISYDIEWHSELIKNNKTGFLFNEGDIDSVVKQINDLLNDPQKSLEIAEKARNMVDSNHSLKVTINTKQKFYDKLFVNATL